MELHSDDQAKVTHICLDKDDLHRKLNAALKFAIGNVSKTEHMLPSVWWSADTKNPKKTISLFWLFDNAWSNDEELHQYALKVYDKVDQCKAFFVEQQCNNVDADIAEFASSARIRIK